MTDTKPSILASPQKSPVKDQKSAMNQTMKSGWNTQMNKITLDNDYSSSNPMNKTLLGNSQSSKKDGSHTSQPIVKRNLQTINQSSRQRSPAQVLQNAWGFSNKKMNQSEVISESGTSYAVPSSKRFTKSNKQAQDGAAFSQHGRSSTVSAREMAIMGLKKKHEFGVDGYDMIKFNAHLDKPQNVRIYPGLKKTYIDEAVRAKGFIPPPHYEVMGTLVKKNGQSGLCKSPRNTIALDAERLAKKETRPAPCTYDPKPVVPRMKGCFNFKQDRVGQIEDAQHKSAVSPSSGQYKQSYKLVEKGVSSPKFNPISKSTKGSPFGNFKQATHLISPTSYKNNDSYKKSQLAEPRFYISSVKGQTLVDKTIKQKQFVPGSGSYNPEKAYSIITKGASRGWK